MAVGEMKKRVLLGFFRFQQMSLEEEVVRPEGASSKPAFRNLRGMD